MKTAFILAFLSVFMFLTLYSQQNDGQPPENYFMSQNTPSDVPEIFAAGIVSTDAHEFSLCVSPDGKEIYFTRRLKETNQTVIMFSRLSDSGWTAPEITSFSEQFTFEAMITPDNSKLYYHVGRTVEGALHMYTMYVERESDGWSEPIEAGEQFNPDKTMYISSTLDGTIYTTDISGGMGNEFIGVIKPVNGGYSVLERLSARFNSEMTCQYPWVSPDGKYLLFSTPDFDKPMNSTMFISYSDENGIWSEPKLIDLGMRASQPFVSYDGKYLFFSSGEPGKGDIYWVSTEILN
ncbi:PD40 domain-containing protein [candidate division WOR-3 bacterium]|nr:PD40 domain-containing protein [candidate division WOR-3 bacterium]